MKRLLALIMVVCMAACVFVGCTTDGSGKNNTNTGDSADLTKIGVIQFGEFDALLNAYDGFVAGLKEAGYEDGKNIKINYQSAAADTANCPTIADSLVNDGSDLILAIATPSATTMKEKTTTIPILFTAVTDAVESELVASNEVPGGNITGTSDMNPISEQINLLQQILPEAKTVAVLYCSSESNSYVQYQAAKAEIESKGMTCIEQTISEVSELKSAVESLKGKADALYIPTDNVIADAMTTAAAAANEVKIPIITGEGGMVKDGGLATYGIDYFQLGKQTAEMAVEIIKDGKNPKDMPVQFQNADTLEISVNTDTAAALGITLPEDVLAKAVKYPAE